MNAIKEICHYTDIRIIFLRLSSLRFDQITPSIHAVQILAPWCTSSDTTMSGLARYTVSKMLPYIKKRDDRWIASAHDIYGLPEHILRGYISRGDDSVLLAIFNHAVRNVLLTDVSKWEMLSSISKFDICNTVPGLQHEFCAQWNLIIQIASTTPYLVRILGGIRQPYIALHQGTDAAPTAFDASTPSDDIILDDLRSYPSCNVAAHHPDTAAFPHQSHSESQLLADGSTAVQQAAEVNVTLQHPSSTDQAPPPYSEESLLPPPTTAPGLFSPQADVVASPSIHEYAETIAPDLIPLISMVTHLPHQPPLSTADVVHAEEDVSPQIAIVSDTNLAVSSGSLSTWDHRDDVVHSRSFVMKVNQCHRTPTSMNMALLLGANWATRVGCCGN